MVLNGTGNSSERRQNSFWIALVSTREDFDPSSESIHGLLSGSSNQKEAPEEEDEPMNDP